MADESKADDEDYMGDLSLFLPPEEPNLPPKKNPNPQIPPNQPSSKKPKTQNWQTQRKLNRERTQREEDEKTLVNIKSAIPQSNIGFKMLRQMGYEPGSVLGKGGSGQVEPVGLEIRRSRAGIGREDPVKEKMRRELEKAEREREEREGLRVEFESRKKLEWKGRRVVGNYHKAKASLEQLEGKEVVVKKEEVEGEEEEEEEEEEITEEGSDLVLTSDTGLHVDPLQPLDSLMFYTLDVVKILLSCQRHARSSSASCWILSRPNLKQDLLCTYTDNVMSLCKFSPN